MKNDKKLIEDYLNYYRTGDSQYWWAYEKVEELTYRSENLILVYELLSSCKSDREIAYVAAGPLTDMFTRFYPSIEEELDRLIRHHLVMRKALQGIILTPGSREMKTLTELLNRYGLKYASL